MSTRRFAASDSALDRADLDAFADEHGRQTHLHGPIAKALMAKAPDLFAKATLTLECSSVQQCAKSANSEVTDEPSA